MTKDKTEPQEIADEALDDAQGGIALLLPAVQKAREAARSTSSKDAKNLTSGDDGQTEYGVGNVFVKSYSTGGSAE